MKEFGHALAHASGIAFVLFAEQGSLGSVVFADPRGSLARWPLQLASRSVVEAGRALFTDRGVAASTRHFGAPPRRRLVC